MYTTDCFQGIKIWFQTKRKGSGWKHSWITTKWMAFSEDVVQWRCYSPTCFNGVSIQASKTKCRMQLKIVFFFSSRWIADMNVGLYRGPHVFVCQPALVFESSLKIGWIVCIGNCFVPSSFYSFSIRIPYFLLFWRFFYHF